MVDPSSGRSAAPEFLRALDPDFVAVRDDDHVVVEIEEARTLKGSNELTELAARVAGQEGWRLELVALASDPTRTLPGPTTNRLGDLSERSRLALARGLPEVAFVYATALLEELVWHLAAQSAVRARGQSPLLLARELVFRGVVSEEVAATLRDAWSWRDRFVHARREAPPPAPSELDAILDACRSLQSMLAFDAAE